jgi:GNAT superfamily N-acetyltransferase
VIFAYLADVFILTEYRGSGLSKSLMKFILDFAPYKKMKRILLRTRDAHGLYAQYGFKPLADPAALMEFQPSETN